MSSDHTDRLAGGEGEIHVRISAGIVHRSDRAFVLLRQARHDGYGIDLLRIHAQNVRIVALGHRAEHLLRGLRGGELIHELRIMRLHEAHPARAAGGEHRELVISRVRHLVKEFAAFLHNGQVSREIRIKDVVRAGFS